MRIKYCLAYLLMMLAFTLATPGTSSAQLSGWAYKVKIDITNTSGTNRVNFPELVTVNTRALISTGQMKTGGADIRFGDTCLGTVTVLQHYVMAAMNTDTTKIWVKVPSIPAGSTKSIYMYFGNPAASSTSGFSGVFPSSLISSGGNVTLTGTKTYDWFEIQKDDTLFVQKESPLKIVSRVMIVNGVIMANGAGHDSVKLSSAGKGPGAGKTSSNNSAGSGGAGYGGSGGRGGYDSGDQPGDSGVSYGTVYGTDISMGSSGGSSDLVLGGAGGGSVTLESVYIEIGGSISANGIAGKGGQARNAGGGSGGGVLIQGSTVIINGNISANGGDGGVGTGTANDDGGGGGGGRIKVFYGSRLAGKMKFSVNGGTGGPYGTLARGGDGQAGSIATMKISFPDDSVSVTGIFLGLSDNNARICRGTPLTVTANTGFTDYRFYKNGNLVQQGSNRSYTYQNLAHNDEIRVTSPGTSCFTPEGVVKIAVDTLPEVVIVSDSAICAGDTLSLEARGAATYQWKSGPANAKWNLVPSGTATYTVYGTDGNGCMDTVSRQIRRHDYPLYVQSSDTTICEGDSTELVVGSTGFVAWKTGATTPSIPVKPAKSGYYSFEVWNVPLCKVEDSIFVQVNPLPNVYISGKASVCLGSSTTLAGNGAVYYKWNTGSTSYLVAVAPIVNTDYSVTGTDDKGCSSTATRTVVVDTLPVIRFTGDLEICKGETAIIQATGVTSWAWAIGGKDSLISVKPVTSTDYSVIGTDDNGCKDTATAKVIVHQLPVVSLDFPSALDTVCINDSPWPLSGGIPAGGAYSGYGVMANQFHAKTTGTGKFFLIYKYTDTFGCTDSAGASIVVDLCAGIAQGQTSNGLKLYPNPVTGGFFYLIGAVGNCEITDLQGRSLMYVIAGQNRIETGALPSGIYCLKDGHGKRILFEVR